MQNGLDELARSLRKIGEDQLKSLSESEETQEFSQSEQSEDYDDLKLKEESEIESEKRIKVDYDAPPFELDSDDDFVDDIEQAAEALAELTLDTNVREQSKQLEYLLVDLLKILKLDDIGEYLASQIKDALLQSRAIQDLNVSPKENVKDYISDLKNTIHAFNKEHKPEQNKKYKSFSDYQILSKLNESDLSISHEVYFARSKEKEDDYVIKVENDRTAAQREVMSQEFMRLVKGFYPETYLGRDEEDNILVISKLVALSEAIPGAKSMEDMVQEGRIEILKNNLKENIFHGMGSGLLMCMVTGKTDAKLANFVVDKEGNIISIDGGSCLSRLRHPEIFEQGSEITAADVERLPMIQDYTVDNWVDVILHGEYNAYYVEKHRWALFDEDFTDNELFRQDINEAALKMFLLPKEILQHFFSCYSNNPGEVRLVTEEYAKRIEQLRDAMLVNEDFLQFIRSPAAEATVAKSIAEIAEFKTPDAIHIIDERQIALLKDKFSKLKTDFQENSAAMQAARSKVEGIEENKEERIILNPRRSAL